MEQGESNLTVDKIAIWHAIVQIVQILKAGLLTQNNLMPFLGNYKDVPQDK